MQAGVAFSDFCTEWVKNNFFFLKFGIPFFSNLI